MAQIANMPLTTPSAPTAATTPRAGKRFFDLSQVRDILGIDTRALAFLRAGIAIQILRDLAERAPYIADHYSDWGLLPRDILMRTFGNEVIACLYMMSGNSAVVAALFIINALLAIALLVGYRTRLVGVLCYVMLLSLEARNPLVTNSGDVLFRMILFWGLFMPLGARWSVDRALARRDDEPAEPRTYVSMATIALLVQLCLIYWFGAALKFHPVWYEGRAVWYALNVDMYATQFGVWLRGFPALLPWLTWCALGGEILGPLVAAVGLRKLRVAAIFAMILMHLSFGMCLDIGVFTFVTPLAWAVFLPACFWDGLARWLFPAARLSSLSLRCVPNNDAAHATVRLVREFLLPPSVPIYASPLPAGATWGVVDANGHTHVGWPAVRRVIDASPWTRGLRYLIDIPLVNGLTAMVFSLFAGLRALAVRWILHAGTAPVSFNASWLGNAVVAVLLAYVLMWNFRGLPPDIKGKLPWKWEMPQSWNSLTRVIRIDQRWSMFAPIPMTGDGWYVVPARLVDGRRIDLLTGKPVNWEKPANVSERFIDQRWRKWMENMIGANADNLLGYGRYLARSWNQRQDDVIEAAGGPPATAPSTQPAEPGSHVSTFHIVYVREETTDTGTAPLRRIILWRHNARGNEMPSDDGALD